MKKRSCLFMVLAAVMLAFWCLSGCSAEQEEKPDPPAVSEPEPAEADQEKEAKPVLELGPDGKGTMTEPIIVGEEYVVAATVAFQYSQTGDRYEITSIDEAAVEKVSGWYYVQPEAVIDTEKIFLNPDKTEAMVPITYLASIGAGAEEYDGVVTIHLNEPVN